MRLVRIRTMVKNGLHAIALNYLLVRGPKLLRLAGVTQLQALALPPHTAQRRDQSLELLAGLITQIRQLADAIATAAGHPDLKRTYFTLVQRRGRPTANVPVARQLLVRLFIMLRDQIDYDECRRRGRRTPAIASV